MEAYLGTNKIVLALEGTEFRSANKEFYEFETQGEIYISIEEAEQLIERISALCESYRVQKEHMEDVIKRMQ